MVSPKLFTSVIESYLPEPQAALLNGILFGIPLKTTAVFYQKLKVVGLLHIVVLSGMNIAILISIVSSVTLYFGKKISVVLSMLTVILFVIFVGPQAPIIRSAFMGILTLVAILYGRRSFALYSLFLSTLFIALFWPKWIGSVSFQLSFGATLGIILFGQTSSKNELWRELKTSLAAQVFTAPIIFLYFKQVSLIAPLSNILIAGLIPPLMIFGFLTAILGKINFYLGLLPAYICYGILTYIVLIVELLSKIPFVFFSF